MQENIKVYYLEIVTPNVEQVCASYSHTLQVTFSEPVAVFGGAQTATLSNGGTLGVRAPMHEGEEPTTRPYYLVDDIDKAVNEAEAIGAEVLVPPMEIPGHGQCAIVMLGTIQSGFWQI